MCYCNIVSKIRGSLFSLGASGSIAKTATYQRNVSGQIARAKPEIPYRKSLQQQYQRWLYEDYVQYWHEQSLSVKQQWETNARPYHMTGFAYWMKYHLTNLPDIAGLWHLDHLTGSIVRDFSRNDNSGTVTGGSFVSGAIDNAFNISSTSDYINCGNDSSLALNYPFTLAGFIYPIGQNVFGIFVDRGSGSEGYTFYTDTSIQSLRFHTITSVENTDDLTDPYTFPLNTLHHFAFIYDGSKKEIFIDGSLSKSFSPRTGNVVHTSVPFMLGKRYTAPYGIVGYIDHLALYSRILSPVTILAHSLRRYP